MIIARQGHELLIITATNRFITEPIANEFKIDNLIACEPEEIDGQYTGKVSGTPSYGEGKVTRLNEWLDNQEQKLRRDPGFIAIHTMTSHF